MPRKNKQERLREQIKKDLLDQMDRNGTVGTYYTDMIDDYMKLWDTKNGLTEDINTRGTKVIVHTASSDNIKTNDSVLDLIKTNAQMLKLLESLRIKPAQEDGGADDEM